MKINVTIFRDNMDILSNSIEWRKVEWDNSNIFMRSTRQHRENVLLECILYRLIPFYVCIFILKLIKIIMMKSEPTKYTTFISPMTYILGDSCTPSKYSLCSSNYYCSGLQRSKDFCPIDCKNVLIRKISKHSLVSSRPYICGIRTSIIYRLTLIHRKLNVSIYMYMFLLYINIQYTMYIKYLF